MQGTDANLYLVGFMGSGKSTVGWHAAKQLQFQLIDSDREIEKVAGKAISEIFAQDGEPAFRAMERTFAESGHPDRGCVVACGGGLIVAPGMLELLQRKGVVVCLHAPLETILERTVRHSHRPLLEQGDKEQRIRELYAQREELYRRAGTMVLTDKRPLREIVGHVLRVYRREAAAHRTP
jgi:shikimate kinase